MGSDKRKKEGPSQGTAKPIADPRAMMERTMREIGKLDLSNMTLEEARAYIEEQLNSGRLKGFRPETPLEHAQELVYQAWEATGRHRQALARRALEVSPDCADAYVVLAQEAPTSEEARELYQQGVEAGERALGPEAFANLAGEFWNVIETRPYMRARAGLAGELWSLGETEQAAAHYAELLRLDPSDHQGVRFLQIECLIELGRDRDAQALIKQYKDDVTASWAYARALLAFRRQGETRQAARALAKAMDGNPFAPPYLLGLVTLPDELPEFIGLGDEAEAIDYAAAARRNWGETPGALEWLAHEWGEDLLRRLRLDYEIASTMASARKALPEGVGAGGPTAGDAD